MTNKIVKHEHFFFCYKVFLYISCWSFCLLKVARDETRQYAAPIEVHSTLAERISLFGFSFYLFIPFFGKEYYKKKKSFWPREAKICLKKKSLKWQK